MTPHEFPWYALFFSLAHPLPEPAFVTGVWGPSLLSYTDGRFLFISRGSVSRTVPGTNTRLVNVKWKKEPRTQDLFTFFQSLSYNHSTKCQRIISPTVPRPKTILSPIWRHYWGEKRALALPSGLSFQFLFCLSTVFPTWKQVSFIPLLPV